MSTPQDNNKRIAKNTLMLYFRMLLTIAITLYTSRVVLEQLGENDYGIYNVVGGIVTMFSILSSSLSSSISRFLTYELGKKNIINLKGIFSTAVCIQFGLSLVVVILAETGGVWFLNNKMNIAHERLIAANWVLQCSVITFIINMLSVPYNAAIIAHEKMSAFAYIGILEVSLKLAVALLLFIPFFDSLIVYAMLLVGTSAIIRFTYSLYCKRHFEECHFMLKFDKKILKEMLGYSSWNFIGSSSAVLKDQGVNIVMNIFCGTAVNAARGIAVQVNSAIHGFSQNFMLAVHPQIIKSYAVGDKNYMFNLGFRSARLSYYLLLCLSFPIIVEMPKILGLWLTIIPPYTVSFARLVLILGMSEAISIPLQFMNNATGKIKVYQLTVGGLQMLNFPIAYLLLWRHFLPDSVFVLSIILSQVCLFARLIILKKNIELPVKTFLIGVYYRILGVTLISGVLMYLIYFITLSVSFHMPVIMMCLITFVVSVLICYGVGTTTEEKKFISYKVVEFINKLPSNYA